MVETGHPLLHHASISLKYWTYAFDTTIYNINHLPLVHITPQNPYEKLFHTVPNYSELRSLVICATLG